MYIGLTHSATILVFTFSWLYYCFLQFSWLPSIQACILSFVRFYFNPKIFSVFCCPWWLASLFVQVHESFLLVYVFMYIGLTHLATILAQLLLCRQFLLTSLLIFGGGVSRFHFLLHGRLDYGGDGGVVAAGSGVVVVVVARIDFCRRVVIEAWSWFESCEEPFFKNLLSTHLLWKYC